MLYSCILDTYFSRDLLKRMTLTINYGDRTRGNIGEYCIGIKDSPKSVCIVAGSIATLNFDITPQLAAWFNGIMIMTRNIPREFQFQYGLTCAGLILLEIPFKASIFDNVVSRYEQFKNRSFAGTKIEELIALIDSDVDRHLLARVVSEQYAMNYTRHMIAMS